MRSTSRFAVILALASLGGAGALGQSNADPAPLYKAKCQACHGADGKATPAGQKLGAKDFNAPDVAKMSDAELFDITKKGKGKMPGYDGKLTDDQIKALIKYIRTLK
jgi:cytochrome c6